MGDDTAAAEKSIEIWKIKKVSAAAARSRPRCAAPRRSPQCTVARRRQPWAVCPSRPCAGCRQRRRGHGCAAGAPQPRHWVAAAVCRGLSLPPSPRLAPARATAETRPGGICESPLTALGPCVVASFPSGADATWCLFVMPQLIRGLEAARGNGTSMISLIMHPRDQARTELRLARLLAVGHPAGELTCKRNTLATARCPRWRPCSPTSSAPRLTSRTG